MLDQSSPVAPFTTYTEETNSCDILLPHKQSNMHDYLRHESREVDRRLAKHLLKTNGRLASRRLASLVKEATGGYIVYD